MIRHVILTLLKQVSYRYTLAEGWMCNYRQLNTGVGVCVVGVWLVVLASSSTLYGKVPLLIVKKTNRLTQAVVFFRRHFLCGELLCNCSSAEREGLSTRLQRECAAEPFMRSILSLRIFTSIVGSHLRFFIAMQIQYSY